MDIVSIPWCKNKITIVKPS